MPTEQHRSATTGGVVLGGSGTRLRSEAVGKQFHSTTSTPGELQSLTKTSGASAGGVENGQTTMNAGP
jgi:hypothetical protein